MEPVDLIDKLRLLAPHQKHKPLLVQRLTQTSKGWRWWATSGKSRQMAPEGLEHPQHIRKKTINSDAGGAESGARRDLSTSITPELASLIDAWADLPEPVQRGILAMVEAAKGEGR